MGNFALAHPFIGQVLNALENAIEMMSERIVKMRRELAYSPPRLNALQQILQGSVVVQVNAGPVAIAEIFLGNESFPREMRLSLLALLREFLKVCQERLCEERCEVLLSLVLTN